MEKVLICDDSEYLRLTIKKLLNNLGHEVIAEAENGAVAIEKFIQHKPTFITMDIVMPKFNGLQALEKLIQIDPDVKVMIVTAIGHDIIVKKALKMGAMGYVIKPFTSEEFKKSFYAII